MFNIRAARVAALSAFAIFACGSSAMAADTYRLEISLETGPNHIRNIGVTEWAEELSKKSGGKIEVRIFHGAAKYKDTDVPKALNQGALDMGFPGTWQLGKFVSDFDSADLPLMYGVSYEDAYKISDGKPGKWLADKLEKKLGVKVIGRWLDLGFQNVFTVTKAIDKNSDLTGLKIRIPGGAAYIARFEALGANPVKIAWPDVPQALQRGTIDGLSTTFESARSAKLWDSGVKHAYVANQSFSQYVPTIGGRTWAKYPKEIQDLIVSTWESKVDDLRKRARARQDDAMEEAKKNGMTVVVASKEDSADAKKKYMAKQDQLVKDLRIDPALVKLIHEAIGH